MRYAGPREAILHATVRKTMAVRILLLDVTMQVSDYYGTYEAQELISQFEDELDIQILKFEHAFIVKNAATWLLLKHAHTTHQSMYI